MNVGTPDLHVREFGVRLRLIIALVLLVVVASPSAASDDEVKFSCSYTDKGVQTEWSANGEPEISHGGFGNDTFILTLNVNTGEAKLLANSTIDVVAVPSGKAMNFIEDTPTGLSIISIYYQAPLGNGRLPFVQSRHLDLAGPFPQQYYGSCQPHE